MTSINTSMIALVRALMNFVEERPVVARERRYSFPFFFHILSHVCLMSRHEGRLWWRFHGDDRQAPGGGFCHC